METIVGYKTSKKNYEDLLWSTKPSRRIYGDLCRLQNRPEIFMDTFVGDKTFQKKLMESCVRENQPEIIMLALITATSYV